MLFGWTPAGTYAFADIPDPTAPRQGAIVANLSTNPRETAVVATAPKVNGTLITSPGR